MSDIIGAVARELWRILEFVLAAFAHTWPLWALSIPLAAAVKMSSLSKRLGSILSMRPLIAVLFATAVGALSPLCSCSVIPVIFSLLSAGVPLAPVMSFWLASPSMDPEIFLLSVSTIGWPLAVARLAATTLMSLGGGLLVMLLDKRGFFSGGVLREMKGQKAAPACACGTPPGGEAVPAKASRFSPFKAGAASSISTSAACSCSAQAAQGAPRDSRTEAEQKSRRAIFSKAFAAQFGHELVVSLAFVARFMAIAFVLEALIKFYVPESLIRAALGTDNIFAVPIAVLVGIPFYTTNAQALGMVGGLLGKGMSEAAALSFLIGGATTTLPAISAVYGIAKPRVFSVYLGMAVASAFVAGLAWELFFM